jgi:hypothetical protein
MDYLFQGTELGLVPIVGALILVAAMVMVSLGGSGNEDGDESRPGHGSREAV